MTVEFHISAPRVLLRRFTLADTEKVFLMSQEEGIRTWIPSQVYHSKAHTAEVLELLISHYESGGDPRKGPLVLGVELKATGELVGHVGLSPFEDAVEIGYAIERAHQRRGLASEASDAMCRWTMAEYSIQTVLGITASGNIASQRVLLRIGFVRREERVMRLQGKEQPAVVYELRSDGVESKPDDPTTSTGPGKTGPLVSDAPGA